MFLSISVDVHMLLGDVIVFGFMFSIQTFEFVDESLLFSPHVSPITSPTLTHDLLCDYTQIYSRRHEDGGRRFSWLMSNYYKTRTSYYMKLSFCARQIRYETFHSAE